MRLDTFRPFVLVHFLTLFFLCFEASAETFTLPLQVEFEAATCLENPSQGLDVEFYTQKVLPEGLSRTDLQIRSGRLTSGSQTTIGLASRTNTIPARAAYCGTNNGGMEVYELHDINRTRTAQSIYAYVAHCFYLSSVFYKLVPTVGNNGVGNSEDPDFSRAISLTPRNCN